MINKMYTDHLRKNATTNEKYILRKMSLKISFDPRNSTFLQNSILYICCNKIFNTFLESRSLDESIDHSGTSDNGRIELYASVS